MILGEVDLAALAARGARPPPDIARHRQASPGIDRTSPGIAGHRSDIAGHRSGIARHRRDIA
jgi:hypothetical protein